MVRENGTVYGFIMRLVDQRGRARAGMRRNTWPTVSTTAFPIARVCVRACVNACTAKGMTAPQLSTRKLGNEPSRSPGLLPNKIYTGIRGMCFFSFHLERRHISSPKRPRRRHHPLSLILFARSSASFVTSLIYSRILDVSRPRFGAFPCSLRD